MVSTKIKAQPEISQTETAYAQLRAMIINCELAPGSRLTERQLIQKLGIGRTPVREALVRLDQDRLIETLPRSGYRVTRLHRKSIEDFFTVWIVLAPLMTKLAFSRMTHEDRTQLIEIGRRLRSSTACPSDLSKQAGEFFGFISLAADNDLLLFIYKRLGADMERLFLYFFHTPQGKDWVSNEHDVAAFAALRDPNRAAALVEARIRLSMQGTLEYFDMNGMLEPIHIDTLALAQ